MKKEDIHPFARIVAISDVFDALQNNRIYRKGLKNEKIINILHQMANNNELDINIINEISNHLLPFPIGSRIRLYNHNSDNALEGVVIDIKDNIKRPIIQTLKINQREYNKDLIIDLEKELIGFKIVEII